MFTDPKAEAADTMAVHETCPLAELKDRAIAAASRLAGEGGLDRKPLQLLKEDIYMDTSKALTTVTFSMKSIDCNTLSRTIYKSC